MPTERADSAAIPRLPGAARLAVITEPLSAITLTRALLPTVLLVSLCSAPYETFLLALAVMAAATVQPLLAPDD